jgi:hypothetical protein
MPSRFGTAPASARLDTSKNSCERARVTEQYRAAIVRRGAETEYVYGKDLEKLTARAVKILSKPLPTCPSVKVITERKVGSMGKNHSLWEKIQEIPA